MKKIKFLFLTLFIFALTGCSLPFSPNGENEIADYINKNEDVLLSSNAIDEKVKESVKKYTENKEVDEQIENEVKKMMLMQQDLYDEIKLEKAPNQNEKIKYHYLDFVDYRITSYQEFLDVIYLNDKDTLKNTVEVYEKTNQLKENKLLEEVNIILAGVNVEPRVSLTEQLCDGEDCNKEKKKEKK